MKKLLSVMICILLLASLTVVAFAEQSPTGTTAFQVEIIIYDEDKEPEVKPIEIVQEGDTIIISVPEDDQKDFTGWVIEGDYEIISGSLDDPQNLVIRPLGDIVIHETHDNVGPTEPTSPTDPSSPTDPTGTSPVSPPTGENNLLLDILFVALLLGGVGAAIAVKKLAARKNG